MTTILGLVGRQGSGKDTVASFIAPRHLVRIDGRLVDVRKEVKKELDDIQHRYGRGNQEAKPAEPEVFRTRAVQAALADPMKAFLKQVYDWSYLTLWGPSEYRNAIDAHTGIRPRIALQLLGTEWGRAMWEGTWVNAGINFARELLDKQHIKKPDDAHTFAPNWVIGKHDLVVFSDIRFQNEVDMIHEAGGKVWRIVRARADGEEVLHASEVQDMVGVDFDLVNNGTLDELRTAVKHALEAKL